MATLKRTPEDRFWSKVQKTSACWLWSANRRGGYGQFWLNGRFVPAHRWSYEQVHGQIADGLQMDHLCRVPACVNPAHLEPVSLIENVLRGYGLPAINARRTYCKRGHALTASPYGGRRCVECVRRIKRESWRRCRERKAQHG
jgi:hypothetical protein